MMIASIYRMALFSWHVGGNRSSASPDFTFVVQLAMTGGTLISMVLYLRIGLMYSRTISKSPVFTSQKSAPMTNMSQA
jgi:hypothetical protein